MSEIHEKGLQYVRARATRRYQLHLKTIRIHQEGNCQNQYEKRWFLSGKHLTLQGASHPNQLTMSIDVILETNLRHPLTSSER